MILSYKKVIKVKAKILAGKLLNISMGLSQSSSKMEFNSRLDEKKLSAAAKIKDSNR
jgi:hypothetical protein